jgi:hypothetical protein
MRRRLAVAACLLLTAAPALASPGSATRDGRTLSVSDVDALAVEGQKVRVTGRGYDRSKGIYIAFCVDNGPGKVPTPCGGGADTEGSSGNSVWISDLPPAYGTGLAKPYGDGGSFDVEISVRAQLDEEVDCRTVRCAVVTRNDHTRSEDRSQDLGVPVTFAAAATVAPAAPPPAGQAPVAGRPAPRTAASASATASPTASGSASPTATPLPTGSADPSASPYEVLAGTTSSEARSDGGSDLPIWSAASLALLLVLGGAGAAVRQVRLRRRQPEPLAG